MKRAVLIAGGTVGGLGAVLSITPPQIGSNLGLGATAASATTLNNNSATAINKQSNSSANLEKTNATPSASPSKSKKSSTKKKSSGVSSNNNSNSNSNNSTVGSSGGNVGSNVNGTFTGDAIDVSYGIVQVKITVTNGKITDAVAVQSPTGRSQRFSDYAIPNLKSETLSVQSAAIQGVSGASYTSYGWYKSLISALQKAGMKTGV